MTRRRFCQLVRTVMTTLPAAFQPYLENLVVDVEEQPDRSVLRGLGVSDEEIDEGSSIYGLFIPSEFDTGDGLGGVAEFDQPPHRIIIYRKPLVEDFSDEQLEIEVRKTVVHELAHHFGWSDKELEQFDDKLKPFGHGEGKPTG